MLTARSSKNSNTNTKQEGYVDGIPEPKKGSPKFATKLSLVTLK